MRQEYFVFFPKVFTKDVDNSIKAIIALLCIEIIIHITELAIDIGQIIF